MKPIYVFSIVSIFLLSACGQAEINTPIAQSWSSVKQTIKIPVTKTEPVQQKTSNELDSEDLIYQMDLITWSPLAIADYGFEKYYIGSESGRCMEDQMEKTREYRAISNGKIKDKPSAMLPTKSCDSGGSYKTWTGFHMALFASAVRVRNKELVNFDGATWDSLDAVEICDLVGKTTEVSTPVDPKDWYRVLCD